MRKVMTFLLVVGILVCACAFQVAAESIYGDPVSFVDDEPLGDPLGNPIGDPAPCGGGGDGGGGTPG